MSIWLVLHPVLSFFEIQPLKKNQLRGIEKGDVHCLKWIEWKSRSQHTGERLVLCLCNMQNQPANIAFVFSQKTQLRLHCLVCKCTSWVQTYLVIGCPCMATVNLKNLFDFFFFSPNFFVSIGSAWHRWCSFDIFYFYFFWKLSLFHRISVSTICANTISLTHHPLFVCLPVITMFTFTVTFMHFVMFLPLHLCWHINLFQSTEPEK